MGALRIELDPVGGGLDVVLLEEPADLGDVGHEHVAAHPRVQILQRMDELQHEA